ncbi:MAG: hypothetical protein MRZ46_01285 [Oscillospiraceae bacterium]|nr:hypothetical protein [Oscillospiraceae bacterium]
MWGKLPPEARTTDALLRTLDFDFFQLLDSVTIARSRKHIEKYYNTAKIGKFPERLKPISVRPALSDLSSVVSYKDIYESVTSLNLSIYTPSLFIFDSKREKYMGTSHNKGNMTQIGRERGVRKLMSINLLKRLESSVNLFVLTLTRIKQLIDHTINTIDNFKLNGLTKLDMYDVSENDFDIDDTNNDFVVGKKVQIDLADVDIKSWRKELAADSENIEILLFMLKEVTPEHDKKLQTLFEMINNKIENPINPNNKKIIIFSAFADTAMYLYDNIAPYVKKKFGLNTAVVSGTVEGKTTLKGVKASLNNILTLFSPISKDKAVLMPNVKDEIDILIATDCISEGQNLQDCDYLINYDIH